MHALDQGGVSFPPSRLLSGRSDSPPFRFFSFPVDRDRRGRFFFFPKLKGAPSLFSSFSSSTRDHLYPFSFFFRRLSPQSCKALTALPFGELAQLPPQSAEEKRFLLPPFFPGVTQGRRGLPPFLLFLFSPGGEKDALLEKVDAPSLFPPSLRHEERNVLRFPSPRNLFSRRELYGRFSPSLLAGLEEDPSFFLPQHHKERTPLAARIKMKHSPSSREG